MFLASFHLIEGSVQNALAFLENEKWLCKMRWHFSKMKNGFAKCAGISRK